MADFLKNLEMALIPFARESDPQAKLALIGIESGSLTLSFPSSTPIESSLEELSLSLKSGALRNLSEASRKAVAWIGRWVRKSDLTIEFSVGNRLFGSITPELDLKLEAAPRLRGSVTIHGVLRSVGGERPTLKIRTLTDELKTVYCSDEIAKQAGKFIYRKVQLIGDAKTSALTGDIEEVTAISIQLLDTKLSQGFKRMREKFGRTFNSVDPKASEDKDFSKIAGHRIKVLPIPQQEQPEFDLD